MKTIQETLEEVKVMQLIGGLTLAQLHKYFSNTAFLQDLIFDDYADDMVSLEELETLARS